MRLSPDTAVIPVSPSVGLSFSIRRYHPLDRKNGAAFLVLVENDHRVTQFQLPLHLTDADLQWRLLLTVIRAIASYEFLDKALKRVRGKLAVRDNHRLRVNRETFPSNFGTKCYPGILI